MNSTSVKMERNLALEAVRVTEAAALSASRWMGRGDEKSADQTKLQCYLSVNRLVLEKVRK